MVYQLKQVTYFSDRYHTSHAQTASFAQHRLYPIILTYAWYSSKQLYINIVWVYTSSIEFLEVVKFKFLFLSKFS
jgi:hypothetical protein